MKWIATYDTEDFSAATDIFEYDNPKDAMDYADTWIDILVGIDESGDWKDRTEPIPFAMIQLSRIINYNGFLNVHQVRE